MSSTDSAPSSAMPPGVLLFRHPDHPAVFALYPNGLRIRLPWCVLDAWGSPQVILMNKANGTADGDYADFVAYDRALRQ
ncbi:hypothetical protein [Kitasatospora sp. NPDC094015]|uniref:hypothetical protein n=1 Tax=Kitasatospora sp. NPDC094015 TaxID=3155205 RepID=UPI003328A6AC